MRAAFGLVLMTVWVSVGLLRAQPANNHFSNRVVLTGSSLTFTVNLAGASLEEYESVGPCSTMGHRSVWYELRTEVGVPVFLQSLAGSSNAAATSLTVYASTNPPPDVMTARPSMDCVQLNTFVERQFLGFEPQPGFAYYIQVLSDNQGASVLQLDVSRDPLLIEHPRDVTANPGDAALFKAAAISVTPKRYQWRKEDAPLDGETSPMLMLTNLTAADSGGYSVVISNSTGAATSRVAQLRIAAAAVGPLLRIAPGGVPFTSRLEVDGDVGRCYRVESSTNLIAWQPEPLLNRVPAGSVYAQTNEEVSLTVTSTTSRKFFRIGTYVSANSVCEANLKRIRHAKELWARDVRRYSPYDSSSLAALLPYYKDSREPRCPAGGTYTMHSLDTTPRCSIASHVLEEPR